MDNMKDYEIEIKRHALEAVPREACGIVLRTSLETFLTVRLPNIAPLPEKSFIIEPSAFSEALKQGSIEFYYHSHPTQPAEFSEADIKACENCGYPALLYSVPEDKFVQYSPKGFIFPLEGRRFVLGVFDCVTLVNDYYLEKFNVKFPLHATSLRDIQEGTSDLEAHIASRSLFRVDNLKEGDILLMSLTNNAKVNHCAIYLGDGHMLHQLMNKRSCRDVYGGHWKNATIAILRR